MDADLLETSLALVDTPDDGLTRHFQAVLSERHPAVRPLFSQDTGFAEETARQARILRSAIVSAVDHLDDPVWLSETLGELGARHFGRGVMATMYDEVTDCMVVAMAELGGSVWTRQMTDAWVEALDAVAGLIVRPRGVVDDLAS